MIVSSCRKVSNAVLSFELICVPPSQATRIMQQHQAVMDVATEAARGVDLLKAGNHPAATQGGGWHHQEGRAPNHGEVCQSTEVIWHMVSNQKGNIKGLNPCYRQLLEGCPQTITWGEDAWTMSLVIAAIHPDEEMTNAATCNQAFTWAEFSEAIGCTANSPVNHLFLVQVVQSFSQFFCGLYVAPHVHDGTQTMSYTSQNTTKGYWLMQVMVAMHTMPWRIPAIRQLIQKSAAKFSETGAIQGSWVTFHDETLEVMQTSKHTSESDSALLRSYQHSQLAMMEQIKDMVKVMATNQYNYQQAIMNPEGTAAFRQSMQRP